jgi:hypothetical protein
MQTVLDQPTAEPDGCLCADASDEEREFALLTQFTRHGSVAALANAIAERLGGGMRGGDLIAAAGLGSSGAESRGSGGAIPVNPGAALRR